MFQFFLTLNSNPDIPKRKADQLAMDDAGTILLKSTAKWAMGGLLISSIISYNFLRPKQRFFGLLGTNSKMSIILFIIFNTNQ